MLDSKEIGKLDRRIRFVKAIIETGTSNEDKITGWENVTSNPTVWASQKDLRGNDVVVGEKVTYLQLTNFVIRERSDLTTRNRLVCDSKVYEIVSIQTDGSRRFKEIKASLLENEPVP